MKYYIVIPAHNEEAFIEKTLTSIVEQTKLPEKVVVVNDNSTDNTASIVADFAEKYHFISKIDSNSSAAHLPGSKVINAFYKGFDVLDNDYDVIVKLDADLILPEKYFETVCKHFENDKTIGICGGLAFIEKDGKWIYETISDKTHVRGPFKAYRKKCFQEIGGLKKALGWDTVDVLVARYFGWKVHVDTSLHVKHLKPTGKTYDNNVAKSKGKVFYQLRYGFLITLTSSLKFAYNKGNLLLAFAYIKGYFAAKKNKDEFLVTAAQGKFIRRFRFQNMYKKLTLGYLK